MPYRFGTLKSPNRQKLHKILGCVGCKMYLLKNTPKLNAFISLKVSSMTIDNL